MDAAPVSEHLQAVIDLAKTCEYEANHTQQVTHLALRLFDELSGLHKFGKDERDQLQYASLLHDIGWVEGWKEHHKVSLRIILTTQLLHFSNKERLVIGSIARYHRKALPDVHHDHFAALDKEEQNRVKLLASLLRFADGLDSTHQNRVRDLTCKVTSKRILVRCHSPVSGKEEQQSAMEKSDLMALVFNRKVYLEWIKAA
jgi:exopolyphosphatase/pppGpp-phosphohydrolase